MTTPIRAAAAFVLAFQLHQLALPTLCSTPASTLALCHESQAPTAPQLDVQDLSLERSCASRAMCGVLATGIPEVAITLAAPDAWGVAALPVPTLLPGDPSPPLSPPPQT